MPAVWYFETRAPLCSDAISFAWLVEGSYDKRRSCCLTRDRSLPEHEFLLFFKGEVSLVSILDPFVDGPHHHGMTFDRPFLGRHFLHGTVQTGNDQGHAADDADRGQDAAGDAAGKNGGRGGQNAGVEDLSQTDPD